ncbi:membrane dipeptidase (peptidase family M19) [Algoriphagus boseongensis]|uniref:Membrane dipeptidase (Peptidase family M19) n=1 Tax=Algoriphagus boseongensis TaxID=1442587 RepID=A0A4R6T4Y3_9BACT|nr:membrane dipeptidase [Algoriphagus boseongensis]TDQ16525.1 membrane dipeptidase (peptidase family M19) [Algoriphagus boseongensis]
MQQFEFADWHVHPNLKTFGHTFDPKPNGNSDLWRYKKPGIFSKTLNRLTGLTRMYQSTFSSMSLSGVKIAFVSYYPFEKGFFVNKKFSDSVTAYIANIVTGIGYQRIRHLQKQENYFGELKAEYEFVLSTDRSKNIFGEEFQWQMIRNWNELAITINQKNCLAIIPTIEGSHVFNSGLEDFGRPTCAKEVIKNVEFLKRWKNPPFFITFGHNFGNDFCGHAPSLEKLGPLVNQKPQCQTGFTKLGWEVLEALLSNKNGKPILIDLKHMSLKARRELYAWNRQRPEGMSPLIVSHGAVTGCSWDKMNSFSSQFFCSDEINFYNEDILEVVHSGGFFALQLDANRLGVPKVIRKPLFLNRKKRLQHSCKIIWAHLRHIAELLDSFGLPAWDHFGIGSDFDGTINPLDEIWTSDDFTAMANMLLGEIEKYLSNPNSLVMLSNKFAEPNEVLRKFLIGNSLRFLEKNFQ